MSFIVKDLLTKCAGEAWYRFDIQKEEPPIDTDHVSAPEKVALGILVGAAALGQSKSIVPTGLFGLTRRAFGQIETKPISQENFNLIVAGEGIRGFASGLLTNLSYELLSTPSDITKLGKQHFPDAHAESFFLKGAKVFLNNKAIRQDLYDAFFIRVTKSVLCGSCNGALVALISTAALGYLKLNNK